MKSYTYKLFIFVNVSKKHDPEQFIGSSKVSRNIVFIDRELDPGGCNFIFHNIGEKYKISLTLWYLGKRKFENTSISREKKVQK